MYKALQVEFVSKKNANYASNNGMYIKGGKVRIKTRRVFDLHDVIVDSRKDVLFEYEMALLSYIKLETRRGVF